MLIIPFSLIVWETRRLKLRVISGIAESDKRHAQLPWIHHDEQDLGSRLDFLMCLRTLATPPFAFQSRVVMLAAPPDDLTSKVSRSIASLLCF